MKRCTNELNSSAVEMGQVQKIAEHHYSAKSKNKKSDIDISVQGDQTEQVCSEEMQTKEEESANQAEQTSIGERDQPACDQAEQPICRERPMEDV